MRLFFLLFILLNLSLNYIFAKEIQIQEREFPKEEFQKQNSEIAFLVAKEISKTLPQVVDKYTTLTHIKSDGTTLLYTFEINSGAKSDDAIRKEDHSRMEKAITEGVCQSSSKFLSVGINTSYIYVSAKTKEILFQFDITQDKCTPLKKY